MEFGRMQKMYGNESPLYTISICVLFLWWGWLIAQYSKFGFKGVFVRAICVLMVVYFMDAIVKSMVFLRKHFSIRTRCSVIYKG